MNFRNLELIENTDRDLSFLRDNLLNEEELKTVNPSASFPFKENYWQNFFNLDGRTVSYLLKYDDTTVGHSALKENLSSQTVWLCWVLIQHQHRGKGIAEKLLEQTERFVVSEFRKNEYFLNVRKYNERAIHFYIKHGFVHISEGEGNYQMKKLINKPYSR